MVDTGPPSQATSLTLIEQARQKEGPAWQRLVQLYSPMILTWCQRAGLQNQDSADILQEVWISVSRHLEQFERSPSHGTFRGWLWTVTRNKVIDHTRKTNRREQAFGGSDAQQQFNELPEVEPEQSSEADSRGVFVRLLNLVRQDFETRTWDAFWQLVIEGKPASVVAEQLGLAPNAVHQARFRVLKRLREELTLLGIANDPSFKSLH